MFNSCPHACEFNQGGILKCADCGRERIPEQPTKVKRQAYPGKKPTCQHLRKMRYSNNDPEDERKVCLDCKQIIYS